MSEKLKDLETKLEKVKFIQKILDSEKIFKTSIKTSSSDIETEVVDMIKIYLKKEVDALLSGNRISPKEQSFSSVEITILKALALKHQKNPKVMALMGQSMPESQIIQSNHIQPIVNTASVEQTGRRSIKVLKPREGGSTRQIGDVGILPSPEDAMGLPPTVTIPTGSEFRIVAPHHVAGVWTVVLLGNPDVRFLVHEQSMEWK